MLTLLLSFQGNEGHFCGALIIYSDHDQNVNIVSRGHGETPFFAVGSGSGGCSKESKKGFRSSSPTTLSQGLLLSERYS